MTEVHLCSDSSVTLCLTVASLACQVPPPFPLDQGSVSLGLKSEVRSCPVGIDHKVPLHLILHLYLRILTEYGRQASHPLTAVLCSSLKVESFRAAMARRLVRVLQICAGHVLGISALNLLSLLRSPENPQSKEL